MQLSKPVKSIEEPPWSAHCFVQCLLPLSWCQSIFDGWVKAEWLACGHTCRWLTGVSEIQGSHKQFAHSWNHPATSAWTQKNIYVLVPGVSSPAAQWWFFPTLIASLLGAVCWAIQLVPIHNWQMGHGRVVNMLDTAKDGKQVTPSLRDPRFTAGLPTHEGIQLGKASIYCKLTCRLQWQVNSKLMILCLFFIFFFIMTHVDLTHLKQRVYITSLSPELIYSMLDQGLSQWIQTE